MPTLICSDCNIEMTRHASKVVHARSDSEIADPELGGVVVERHACAGCGCSGSTYPSSASGEADP